MAASFISNIFKPFGAVTVWLCFPGLLSCNLAGTASKQNSAILFLNKVNQLEESVLPASRLFSGYLQKVGPIAKSGLNYQLEQPQIDSLKNYFGSFMRNIDQATTGLKNLTEFDTSFNIIQPSIQHLEIIRHSYVAIIPTYLLVYKIGWDQASDSTRTIINRGPEILEEGRISASKQRAIQEEEIKKLMNKYRISYPG